MHTHLGKCTHLDMHVNTQKQTHTHTYFSAIYGGIIRKIFLAGRLDLAIYFDDFTHPLPRAEKGSCGAVSVEVSVRSDLCRCSYTERAPYFMWEPSGEKFAEQPITFNRGSVTGRRGEWKGNELGSGSFSGCGLEILYTGTRKLWSVSSIKKISVE